MELTCGKHKESNTVAGGCEILCEDLNQLTPVVTFSLLLNSQIIRINRISSNERVLFTLEAAFPRFCS